MTKKDRNIQLWENLLQGDLNALEQIYTSFHADLYHYALKITSQVDLAEDALQDVFVDIWTHRSTLGRIQSLRAYLLRSVRNQCLKLLKRQQRFTDISEADNFDLIVPEELQLVDSSKAIKQAISIGMKKLSPRQREVLYLKYYNNLDYEELSEVLEINYQSVINHMHKAMIKLRDMDILKHLVTTK